MQFLFSLNQFVYILKRIEFWWPLSCSPELISAWSRSTLQEQVYSLLSHSALAATFADSLCVSDLDVDLGTLIALKLWRVEKIGLRKERT